LSIADNLLTLADNLITLDDASAIIDLVVGTEFNKANKGKSLKKIAELEKKYFRGKTSGGATKSAVGFESVSSGAASRTKFEGYKDELRASMERPAVSDGYLDGLIGKLYRDNARIGSGSTVAEVRDELVTGVPVGGVFHSQKAEDAIKSLEKWLKKNPAARPGDRAAAENIIRDMKNALGGK
jgi:hypothetical protein